MSDGAGGRLVVVAPPPGGSEPSDRAVEVLGSADHVWGDGAPATAGLLGRVGVPAERRTPVGADHDALVDQVAGGATVALVGTGPVVAPLVGAVVDAGLPVEVVPAPDPAVAALVASGLATDHVAVQGTLPAGDEPRTTAVPVRGEDLAAALAAVVAACGPDRPVAVADGTGTGDVWRGTAGEAAAHAPAGDVVLVVAGAPATDEVEDLDDEAVREALRDARARGLSPGRAAAEVAAATGRTRRDVYALGAGLAGDRPDGGDG